MPSASKSALLLSPCLRWAWEGAKEYEDEFADTEKRDKGTCFHGMMDLNYRECPVNRSTVADKYFADMWPQFLLARKWSIDHLEPRVESHGHGAEVHSEVYVAYNFSTGEVHTDETVRDRKYPKLEGYLPGTADLVCVLKDGRLYVADWKTGGGTGADKQLLTLATGLRKVFTDGGTPRKVVLCILYVTEDGVHPVEWEPTEEELEAHALAMQFQLADVGKRTEPVPGIHCTQLYCNHLAYCPGITAAVECAAESPQGLLPASSLVRKYSIADAPTGPEHAGSIMERVTAAKRQLKFYEERIKQYCLKGGRCFAGEFEYSKKADGFRWRQKK